jgi:hypothetical protein
MTGKGLLLVSVSLAVLLARFGSVSVATTVTVFVILPVVVACTGILISAVVPEAIVPRVHVTVVPLTEQLPSEVVMGDWQVPKLQ